LLLGFVTTGFNCFTQFKSVTSLTIFSMALLKISVTNLSSNRAFQTSKHTYKTENFTVRVTGKTWGLKEYMHYCLYTDC